MKLRLVVLGLLTVSSAARAQIAPERRGLTASIGAGPGSADVHCFNCDLRPTSAASGFLRLGYAVAPYLVLDAQARRWAKSSGANDDDFNFFLAGAQYYPRRLGGRRAFFEVGFGYADISFKSPGSPDTLRLQGSVVSGGIGYDIAISRHLFMTPYLNAIATSSEKPKLDNPALVVDPNHAAMRATVMQVGIAVGWQRMAARRYVPAGERGR